MDYCAIGSVKDLIIAQNEPIKEEDVSWITLESIKGLSYLHTINIVHCDIKAANILLALEKNKPIVKLADFGVSFTEIPDETMKGKMIGTPLWMSPEVLRKEGVKISCDIWSLGITVIEMLQGLPPHHNISTLRAMRLVLSITITYI